MVCLNRSNEINGLTMGGVGSGTQVDHIEVAFNSDDGVEMFGGTVSMKVSYAFAWLSWLYSLLIQHFRTAVHKRCLLR